MIVHMLQLFLVTRTACLDVTFCVMEFRVFGRNILARRRMCLIEIMDPISLSERINFERLKIYNFGIADNNSLGKLRLNDSGKTMKLKCYVLSIYNNARAHVTDNRMIMYRMSEINIC